MDKSGKSRTIFESKSKAFITTLCQQLSHFQDNNDDLPQTIKIVDLACGDCSLFQVILTKFHDQRNRNNKTQYFGVDKNRIILHYGAVDNLRPSLCLDVVGHNRRRGTLQAVALEGDLWTPDYRLIDADVLIFFGSFVQVSLQREEFKSTSGKSEDTTNNISSELAEVLFSQWRPKIMFMDQDELDNFKSSDKKMWSEQFDMWCSKSALKYNYERRNVYYTDGDGRTKYMTAFMQKKSAEISTVTSSAVPIYSNYNVIYQVDYPGCEDLAIDRPDAFLISQLKQLSIQNTKETKSDEGCVKKKKSSEESTHVPAIKQRKVRTTWEVVNDLITPFKEHKHNEEGAECHDLLRKLIERDDPLVNLLALERDLTIPFIRIFFDTLQMIRKYHILYLHHPRNHSRDDKPDIELRQVAERRLLQRLEQVWKDKGRAELELYATKHYPHLLDANGKLQMPTIGGVEISSVPEGEVDLENNKENQAPPQQQQLSENNENIMEGKEESNKIIETEELEMNLELLERRQRSLDVVKEGEHYIHYLCALPKTQRDLTEPKTPNKFIKMSRRNWDARIRTWRIRVHDWCRDKSSLNLAGGDVPK